MTNIKVNKYIATKILGWANLILKSLKLFKNLTIFMIVSNKKSKILKNGLNIKLNTG